MKLHEKYFQVYVEKKTSAADTASFGLLFTCARKWTYQKQIIAQRIGKRPFAWHIVWFGVEFEYNAMWLALLRIEPLQWSRITYIVVRFWNRDRRLVCQFKILIISTHSLSLSSSNIARHLALTHAILLKQKHRSSREEQRTFRLHSICIEMLFIRRLSFSLCRLSFVRCVCTTKHISLRILYFHCIVSHTNGVANNKHTDKHTVARAWSTA